MYFNEKHKEKVENRGDNYIYIGSYHRNEATIDGKNLKRDKNYIRVKCPYCGKEYDVMFNHFNHGSKCPNCCNTYENSFAYYIQQELKESLNEYWDWKKNTVNPYYIAPKSHLSIILKCDKKDYHDSYKTTPAHFKEGRRCPYCSHKSGKVHPKDSFGSLYPEKLKYWDWNKNKKSPYELAPKSSCEKHWFKCEKCGKSFKRKLSVINNTKCGIVCDDCGNSRLERETKNILEKYNVFFKQEKTFKNLIGLKNGLLSYDFYLPDYNLLIECQGIQHKEWQKTWMSKKDFEKQLEHDERKRNYAKENNINLLEIWYYNIDNIEEMLIKELNKINKEVI